MVFHSASDDKSLMLFGKLCPLLHTPPPIQFGGTTPTTLSMARALSRHSTRSHMRLSFVYLAYDTDGASRSKRSPWRGSSPYRRGRRPRRMPSRSRPSCCAWSCRPGAARPFAGRCSSEARTFGAWALAGGGVRSVGCDRSHGVVTSGMVEAASNSGAAFDPERTPKSESNGPKDCFLDGPEISCRLFSPGLGGRAGGVDLPPQEVGAVVASRNTFVPEIQ